MGEDMNGDVDAVVGAITRASAVLTACLSKCDTHANINTNANPGGPPPPHSAGGRGMPVRITVEIDGAIRATRSNHSTSYVHAESEVVEVVVHTKETVAMLKRAISAKLTRPPADPVNGLNLHRTFFQWLFMI